MPQSNWLITGVSGGFGRIMTEQLLARGDHVVDTVRDLSVMDGLKAWRLAVPDRVRSIRDRVDSRRR